MDIRARMFVSFKIFIFLFLACPIRRGLERLLFRFSRVPAPLFVFHWCALAGTVGLVLVCKNNILFGRRGAFFALLGARVGVPFRTCTAHGLSFHVRALAQFVTPTVALCTRVAPLLRRGLLSASGSALANDNH